jgi:hypothetical protein
MRADSAAAAAPRRGAGGKRRGASRAAKTDERPALCGPSLSLPIGLEACYAWTSSLTLCTTTSPVVIFGGFGSAGSSFSSRIQSAATFVESSACAEVS